MAPEVDSMNVAILSREHCRTAVETLHYFAGRERAVSLVIVETAVRKKFSQAELLFEEAHREFRQYLEAQGTGPARRQSPAKKLWKSAPPGLQGFVKATLDRLGVTESYSVVRAAQRFGVPTILVKKHSSPETRKALDEYEIAYALLTSTAWLIKEPLLSGPAQIINAHCAQLPKHRSLDAMPWSLLDRDPVGVTAHIVDAGVDTGPILKFMEVKPQPGDTLSRLRRRIDDKQPELFFEVCQGLQSGELQPVPQRQDDGVHHRPMTVDELIDAEKALQAMLRDQSEAR